MPKREQPAQGCIEQIAAGIVDSMRRAYRLPQAARQADTRRVQAYRRCAGERSGAPASVRVLVALVRCPGDGACNQARISFQCNARRIAACRLYTVIPAATSNGTPACSI